ncbi:MAG: lipopolysaccharide heptosyltransferase II [Candidatus Aureabacteria bacterium]|nr:lipopolysaccharide heptosyltransferase II [Candidatus Auribacterota bacterium]
MADSKNKILIRAVNWIGDAVMSIPAIKAIRLLYPESHITVLGKPSVLDVLSLIEDIDDFILYEISSGDWGFVKRVCLGKLIKEKCFDKCFIFPNSFDSAIVPFVAGIPERIGFQGCFRAPLLTLKVKRPLPEMHQAEKYFELVKADGFSGNMPGFKLKPGLDSLKWSDDFMKFHIRSKEKIVVGVSPGAEYGPAKRWFPDRFAGLINRLKNVYDAEVVLVGSENDRDVCGSVNRQVSGNIIDMSGKTTIKQLIALLKKMDLLITNDTGTMHLASALGIPVIAVFGSTDNRATSPVTGKVKIVKNDVSCSPCLKRICVKNTYECFSKISVKEVFNEVKNILDKRKG